MRRLQVAAVLHTPASCYRFHRQLLTARVLLRPPEMASRPRPWVSSGAQNCARLGLSMLNPHGMVSRYRVPPPQEPERTPFLSLQIKNSKRSHVIWIHSSWLAFAVGPAWGPGAPKMRGSNGELTSPTTYPPMPFRFTSVGVRPLIG